MKKRILVAVSLVGMAALTSFAGNHSGTGGKKDTSSQVERWGKDLKLSAGQVAELQKLNADFTVQRNKKASEFRKEHAKRKQATQKVLRKEAQKARKAHARMQRNYLQSVKKIMSSDQYVAFLENFWVKQHAMQRQSFSKAPAKGEPPRRYTGKTDRRMR